MISLNFISCSDFNATRNIKQKQFFAKTTKKGSPKHKVWRLLE